MSFGFILWIIILLCWIFIGWNFTRFFFCDLCWAVFKNLIILGYKYYRFTANNFIFYINCEICTYIKCNKFNSNYSYIPSWHSAIIYCILNFLSTKQCNVFALNSPWHLSHLEYQSSRETLLELLLEFIGAIVISEQ